MVNENALDANEGPRSRRLRANAYFGSALVGTNGDALGTVVDFVLDTATGAVAYVVVARGGFMGIGEEHYALPWAYVTPLQGAGETLWRCAATCLPPHYRMADAAALWPAQPSGGGTGTIAE